MGSPARRRAGRLDCSAVAAGGEAALADDEPGVTITLTAIYDRVVGVEKQVGALSAELPNHVSITKDKQLEYETRLENHGGRLSTLDKRLTILEARQVPRAPWWSVVGGVVSVIAGVGTLVTLVAMLSRLGAVG